jgi:UDPglucose 6-dehydrogenase
MYRGQLAMKIAVVGTGYVGLVTGVCLAEIGHHVTCIDIDEEKILLMNQGISPIYEPDLEPLMKRNINQNRLSFTSNYQCGFHNADVIYIAVGTPQSEGGSPNLSYIKQAALNIAEHINRDVIVVTKSTVPVGTNDAIKNWINAHLIHNVTVEIISNPEFLREGSAVHDTFYGDRIVIGATNEKAASVIEEINKPFNIPIFKTSLRSAEMIKFASNAFLAAKISFINEISNICEKTGANIEDVASGMGMDKRIGTEFLNAGIGYGGSCFPKDTKALVRIAGEVDHNFELLKSVIKVNNKQQQILIEKAITRFGSLHGKRIALLGLSFKPNTDDMREAASIVVSEKLTVLGAEVIGYDPAAIPNAKKVMPFEVKYADSIEEVLKGADVAFILTEWEQIKKCNLSIFLTYMKTPIIFDGRNCFDLETVGRFPIEYHSIGRESITNIIAVVEK